MSLLLAKFDDDLATRQAVTPLCITPMMEANTPVSKRLMADNGVVCSM